MKTINKKESKSFVSIWNELKEIRVDNEVEAFNNFLEIMDEKGFSFSYSDYLILATRGGMRMEQLQRCSLHKKFYFSNVKDTINEVYKLIKSKTL